MDRLRLRLRLSRQKWIQALIFCTLVSPAWGASIPYSFQTADIPVPSGGIAFPQDVDDDGTLMGNVFLSGLEHVAVDPGDSRKPLVLFTCASDTEATSISKGRLAGSCIAFGKELGFIRDRNANMTFLDFPGADGTIARGLRGNNVVGQFFGPLRTDHGGALSYRFHGWHWDRLTNQYQQIDFPHDNTFVDIVNINSQGQILGQYIIVDLENNTLESGWFLYDNGLFTLPFPLDFQHIGGDSIFVTDINDDGQALLIRRVAGEVKIQLFDDGIFSDITGFPSDWIPINVRGMNNRAQFVGSYCVHEGPPDPIFGQPCHFHGFIATPAPANQVKAKVK